MSVLCLQLVPTSLKMAKKWCIFPKMFFFPLWKFFSWSIQCQKDSFEPGWPRTVYEMRMPSYTFTGTNNNHEAWDKWELFCSIFLHLYVHIFHKEQTAVALYWRGLHNRSSLGSCWRSQSNLSLHWINLGLYGYDIILQFHSWRTEVLLEKIFSADKYCLMNHKL